MYDSVYMIFSKRQNQSDGEQITCGCQGLGMGKGMTAKEQHTGGRTRRTKTRSKGGCKTKQKQTQDRMLSQRAILQKEDKEYTMSTRQAVG